VARASAERSSRVTPVVIDTDVVSFIFKDDTRKEFYLNHLRERSALISFMTEAEMEQWVLQAAWGEERTRRCRQFLTRFTVVPSSELLSRKWAAVMVQARSAGKRIETADAWIAATALLYEAPLLTHNAADYAGISGLQILSSAPAR
jgi:tRNA(fMet)-specific endonuclease VapC